VKGGLSRKRCEEKYREFCEPQTFRVNSAKVSRVAASMVKFRTVQKQRLGCRFPKKKMFASKK